ncbi:MAG: TlyA family RNA methyltransferase, partial [Chloroflexota bacterium]|nr:TlyA family RNA methyltransferase [Chloroflexota bacterium]
MTKTVASKRARLDLALVEQGIAATRSQARALVLAGDIEVNGKREVRAGSLVSVHDVLSPVIRPRFVSRGGEKLAYALSTFHFDVEGAIAADFGASTGGFTDCLLQAGCQRVYAVDVGYGQLDRRLRLDPRVVVMERVNARYLSELPELVDLVVIDVSFISLSLMFPVVSVVTRPQGACIALIKPQFEAGRHEVGKGGVVRDPLIHRRVVESIQLQAARQGLGLQQLTMSPLRGPAGNVEFLALFRKGASSTIDESLVDDLFPQVEA